MTITYATAINCIDGRVQIPVIEWMKDRLGVDHIDLVTEAGPNGLFASGKEPHLSTIKERVMISVNGRGSNVVALVAHHDCTGNPGPREMQIEQVFQGLEVLRSWDLPRIMGLYVNEEWEVELLHDSAKGS